MGLVMAAIAASPTAANAAEQRYEVTIATDAEGVADPGTLRGAIEAIAADVAGGGPGKDYVVVIADGIGEISLADDLELLLDDEVSINSFTLRNEGGAQAQLDLNGFGFSYNSETLDDRVTLSGLNIRNGNNFTAVPFETGAIDVSNVSFDGIGAVDLHSSATLTLADVSGNSTVIDLAAAPEGAEQVGVQITDSTFVEAPVSVNVPQGVTRVSDSSFTGSTFGTALEVFGELGDGLTGTLLLSDSDISDNQTTGLYVTGVQSTRISGVTATGNSGSSALQIEGGFTREDPASVLITDSVFADNETWLAPLDIEGTANAVTVARTEFSGNVSSRDTALSLGAELSQAVDTNAPDPLLTPKTFRFEHNTVRDNVSRDDSSVTVHEWGHEAGAELAFTSNFFSANSSDARAADITVKRLGDGSQATPNRLSLTANTFAGARGGPGEGQSVLLEDVDTARITLTNNTFDLADSPDSAFRIGNGFGENSVSLEHNTFVGSGVGLSLAEGQTTASIAATVFDTPTDPFAVDCECDPAVVSADTVTRTASAALGGATVATTEEIALTPLADNGGPTPTRLPGDGSVLHAAALAAPTGAAAADQRGVARPAGPGSDIGAVEAVTGSVHLTSDIVVTEGDDAVIPVTRVGAEGFAFELGADVAIVATDGTASAGVDYTGEGGTVTFPAAGVLAPAEQQSSLVIPTTARDGEQGNRSFTVNIASATNGALIGAPQTITVTIKDATSTGGNGNGNGNGNGEGGQPPAPGAGPQDGLAQSGATPAPFMLSAGVLALLAGAAALTARSLRGRQRHGS